MSNEKKIMDRRTFLKTTGVGSASLALSAGLSNNILADETANNNPSREMPTRILGKTGFPASILGLGGMVDFSINQALLRVAFNMGINFWDNYEGYHNGKSEIGMGQYFSKYPEDRKKIFLVTKVDGTINNPEQMTDRLTQSLERLETDYVDLYLLHGIQDPGLLTPQVKAWAEQKKKEGKTRFFGYSAHANMPQMLYHAANLGWIDVVYTSYNFQLMNNDDMKKSIDACVKANIGLIAMKIQGENFMTIERSEDLTIINSFMNKGYTLQQAKHKAVWEDKRIATSLSEMTNLTILKDNVAAATDNTSLSVNDIKMLNRLATNSCNFYCQGCLRCESVMGSDNRIPDILRYMMYYNSYGDRDRARKEFRELPETVKNSLASKDYSPAEHVCPNKIEIGKAMKEAIRILA